MLIVLQSGMNVNNLSLDGWMGGNEVRALDGALWKLNDLCARQRMPSVSPSPTRRASSWTKSMACPRETGEASVL